eukprot:gene9591-11279_t
MEASEKGHARLVKMLQQHEENPPRALSAEQLAQNAATTTYQDTGYALLRRATKKGVNWQDEKGDTVLLEAAEIGHAAIVEYLLANQRLDVNFQGMDGHTALAFAKAHDHYDVEEILLAHPGIVTSISSQSQVSATSKKLSRAAIIDDESAVQELVWEATEEDTEDHSGSECMESASDDGSDNCLGHDLYKTSLMGDEESVRVILIDATIEEVNWIGENGDTALIAASS